MKMRISSDSLGRTFPGGLYKATFTGRKVSTSSQGNPQMRLELTINSSSPAEGVETVGRKVFDNITFTEESLWKANLVFNVVTGSDIPEEEYSADELFDLIWNNVQNKQVTLELEEEQYEGRKRMRISKYHQIA